MVERTEPVVLLWNFGAQGICGRAAAVVLFLDSQPREQVAEVVSGAADRGVPVIVDAAAQLPAGSSLTELTGVGASLAVA